MHQEKLAWARQLAQLARAACDLTDWRRWAGPPHPLQDWIGKPFGTRLHARAPAKGWVYVLEPTPELWTSVLRHRTQILYVADISLAIALMELRPGATVLESGTGSGSMTTSLARAVAPSGHVWSFEFHEQRASAAAKEFQENGLGEVVSLEHRDVEAGGFPEALHGTADAVFLDLPAPWRVVPSAAACLRPNGMLCSFSPCIEQVGGLGGPRAGGSGSACWGTGGGDGAACTE